MASFESPALSPPPQYRTGQNYRNPAWLGPRIGDKLLISLIILTLYLGIGDNLAPDNLINIQSSLFMWALLPAFGAASYVPAIVLGTRARGAGGCWPKDRTVGAAVAFTFGVPCCYLKEPAGYFSH